MFAAKRARTASAVEWVPGAKDDGGPGLALAWRTPPGVNHPDNLPDAELRKFVDLDRDEQLDFSATNDGFAVRIPVQRVLKDLRGGGSDERSDYIKFCKPGRRRVLRSVRSPCVHHSKFRSSTTCSVQSSILCIAALPRRASSPLAPRLRRV